MLRNGVLPLLVLVVRYAWIPDTCQDSASGGQPVGVGAYEAMSTTDSDSRFTAMFESHYDEVLAYCTRRIPRTDEVFVVAWRRIDEVDWAMARPWLFGIARGVLANRWRSLQRRSRLTKKVSGLAATPGESPDVVVVRREQDAEVIAALNRLNATDREVLTLAACPPRQTAFCQAA